MYFHIVKILCPPGYRIALHNDYRRPVIQGSSPQAARANRRHIVLPNGTGYWRSDFVASLPPGAIGARDAGWSPQAFLVEQDANRRILTHYHEQDEFQVVVAGEGLFGRHAVRPVTAHYAGRHTGYGPIDAGPEGLSYLSLRAHSDPGARFLPEWRDRMEKGPKRQLFATPVPAAGGEDQAVIEPQPDGVAAWVLNTPPGARLRAPALPAGAARYHVVLSGQLEGWPAGSVIFGDEAFDPAALEPGARVLCLQFPC